MSCNIFLRIRNYFLHICAFCIVTAFFILLYFSFLKSSMITVTRNICLADFIDLLGSGTFMNLFLVPPCTVFITTLSEHNYTTYNYYIRNSSRTYIILNRIVRIIILSVIISILLVIISTAVAGLFSKSYINWNEYGSYFYLSKRILIDINFLNVFLLSIAKLLFPIIFFSSLACTISLIGKKIFSFLFVVILSASNFFAYIKLIINYILNFQKSETEYFSFSSIVLLFIIFPFLTLITVLLAIKFAKRKDFLN